MAPAYVTSKHGGRRLVSLNFFPSFAFLPIRSNWNNFTMDYDENLSDEEHEVRFRVVIKMCTHDYFAKVYRENIFQFHCVCFVFHL